MNLKRFFRGPWIWIVAVLAMILLVFNVFDLGGEPQPEETDISAVYQLIERNEVDNAEIIDRDQRIVLTTTDDEIFEAYWVAGQGLQLADMLQASLDEEDTNLKGYEVSVATTPLWTTALFSFLPILLIIAIFWFVFSQMQGGGSRVMNFGKSKAKLITKDTPKNTFADVAGADEAGLHRLVSPKRYGGAELGLPVSINVGVPGPQVRSRCQDPVLLEDVLIDFPQLTVIGAHMGHPYEALLIQYMLKWPQLHLMTSAYLATYMDPALVRFMDSSRGRGRLLFASDHPVIPAKKALDAARVDGAGPLASFFRITLPLLSPTVLFVVVINTIASLQRRKSPQTCHTTKPSARTGAPVTMPVMMF
jgi:hypothetical protein